jgi:hypothetical protein
LNNNVFANRLEVMPAFWWLHNMYALARNAWKYAARDKRKSKAQHIEFDSLAPDTVEEILHARILLERWVGEAVPGAEPDQDPGESGRRILVEEPERADARVVQGRHMERSKRETVIIRPARGYEAYGQMLHSYAAGNLAAYLEAHSGDNYAAMCRALSGERITQWANLGGQLIPEHEVERLRSDIASGRLDSWDQIHRRYDQLWSDYPFQKQRHAFAVFCMLTEPPGEPPTLEQWFTFLDGAVAIQELKRDRVYASRKKDFDNPFRLATYRSAEEMAAALGTIDDNDFVRQVRKETESFKVRVTAIKARG